MQFNCPSCKMTLSVAAEFAGRSARCPGCGHRFVVPAEAANAAEQQSRKPGEGADASQDQKQRTGWREADPANPDIRLSLGMGIGITAIILLFGLLLRRTYVYTILFERGWVNFAETFVFAWGMAIVILKFQKLAHQRNALLKDVLPR
ncbi:MAG: hypothetical protein ACKOCN_10705, partial [Planctomycetaceae bacterium]